jgi:hypothetical protein
MAARDRLGRASGRFHGVCKREEARPGYTPVNASEWGETRKFLEDSLLPVLRTAIGGTNVRATPARFYRATTISWQTVVELTYKGKRWEGTESGHWVDCDHLLMTFRYAKGGYGRKKAGRRNPRSNVAWGDANKLLGSKGRRGYESCKIGTAAWDELAERVRAIKEAGHTRPRKFTGSVIDIVVSFHLAHVAIVAKVDSQIARLSALDDSDDDGEEPAESEGGIDGADEPEFFVKPLFDSGEGGHRRRVRDYCSRLLAKTTAEKFCCATCQCKLV